MDQTSIQWAIAGQEEIIKRQSSCLRRLFVGHRFVAGACERCGVTETHAEWLRLHPDPDLDPDG